MKAIIAALLLAAALPAQAGRHCEARQPDADAVVRAMDLAGRTAHALNATGAEVVVIARAGRDLRKYQLRYSHLGLAYRDGNTWRVVHKLNQCGSARADLYRQGLGEFFLDDLYEYQAGVAVPSPAVQAHLLPLLRDNTRATRLHEPSYNMLAYPWATRYQQSNQWAIETLALAQDPTANTRGRAQDWLHAQGYEPTTLRIGPLTRLGARATAANIAFDDHPNSKRFSDRIETVTADSVFTWLERTGLAAPMQVLR
jgi:hypothetical protein